MSFKFKILGREEINSILPLLQKLNEYKIPKIVLEERISEMFTQNYECASVFEDNNLIGVCGLWYCTRHYSGKSVELDHVYIDEDYRCKGIGKQFMKWVESYVKEKGCEAIELNTYVQNYPSHKFYYNLDYEILGYHFLKKILS